MQMEATQIINSFPDRPGAYLHIPFCSTLCPFCPYNKVLYQPDLVKRYFAALNAEVACYVAQLDEPFSSLYIGGGTPTLCLDELAEIIANLPFTDECAIEVYPHHATPSRLRQMQQMGVNYVSLGIQSFDDTMLRYLQRPTTGARNRRAVENTVGQFTCVDVDLIFDVGFADESILLADLALCFEYGVEQISTYPLMRFGFTPFGKSRHDRHKEHEVLRKAEDLAAGYGYLRQSVWTFNRRKAPHYSSITRPFYLGMGAGSASYTGRYFLVNHFGLDQYIRTINQGRLPIARKFRFPGLLSSAYAIFWQAYTGRIAIDQLTRQFGTIPGLLWRAIFNFFALMHWVNKQEMVYVLTKRSRDHYHDLERWVTYHFIEPLWARIMQEHAEVA